MKQVNSTTPFIINQDSENQVPIPGGKIALFERLSPGHPYHIIRLIVNGIKWSK